MKKQLQPEMYEFKNIDLLYLSHRGTSREEQLKLMIAYGSKVYFN